MADENDSPRPQRRLRHMSVDDLSAAVRCVPVRQADLVPSLRPGNMAFVSPIDDYEGPGVYLLGVAQPRFRHVCDLPDGQMLVADGNHPGLREVLSAEAFREAVLGRHLGTAKHPLRTPL